MPRWSPDDIPWSRFDKTRLTPDLLKVVKAAALTENNAGRYTDYLRNVFAGDGEFAAAIATWQAEEEQHGQVLGRYAEMAEPDYDFAATFAKFTEGYVIPIDVTQSVRGSHVGELLARCIVETGTSSFYTAMGEASGEPVLKAICQRIAADELRHYRLFLDGMRRYQADEKVSLPKRIQVAIGRLRESDDDELAFAYHCANQPGKPYDRVEANQAYARLAYRLYRPHHAERAVAMIFKATGLNPQGWLARLASRWAFWKMETRAHA